MHNYIQLTTNNEYIYIYEIYSTTAVPTNSETPSTLSGVLLRSRLHGTSGVTRRLQGNQSLPSIAIGKEAATQATNNPLALLPVGPTAPQLPKTRCAVSPKES